jgi:hypothetical protein
MLNPWLSRSPPDSCFVVDSKKEVWWQVDTRSTAKVHGVKIKTAGQWLVMFASSFKCVLGFICNHFTGCPLSNVSISFSQHSNGFRDRQASFCVMGFSSTLDTPYVHCAQPVSGTFLTIQAFSNDPSTNCLSLCNITLYVDGREYL